MEKMTKFAAIVVAFAVIACVALTPAFAEKEAAKETGEATDDYPRSLLTESLKTVGEAAHGTVQTVGDTVKVTSQTFTGQPEKAPEIVATPVREGTETFSKAVVDTVETPRRAGRKTSQ